MTPMDVSIIIVNYNTKHLLNDCLKSVFAQTRGVTYEVIVVDNASSDGSQDMIKAEFPEVRLIESEKNIGFGRANNLAMEVAKGDYFFLLNSDTILRNNAIKIFYDFSIKNHDTGVLGSILYDASESPSHSYGYFPTTKRLYKDIVFRIASLFHKFRDYPHREISEPCNVEYITGADLWIPRRIYEQTGGFDPQFFLYYEETDLQKRMAIKGVPRILIPGPKILHLEGGSQSGSVISPRRLSQFYKSQDIYINKYASGIKGLIFKITYRPLKNLYLFLAGLKCTKQ